MPNNPHKKFALLGLAMKQLTERAELEEAGFALVKDGDGIDRGQWVQELIDDFPQEVIAVFGCNPFEAEPMLEDMWDTESYEDPASGLSMSWAEWSAFFCNDAAQIVYAHLVDEHRMRRHYEDEAERLRKQLE